MLVGCEEKGTVDMNDRYGSTVLADSPIGYWRLNERSYTEEVADESEPDKPEHRHHGAFKGSPILGVPGAIQGNFNCSMTFAPSSYIEVPHSPAFSIQTSGQGLTVEVWMRPDKLHFPTEQGTNYIHWLGKGDYAGSSPEEKDRMEWGFRFYSNRDPRRPNRISAYAWNPQGGFGAGAYARGDLVKKEQWLHLVACYEHYLGPCGRLTGVQLFVNGQQQQGPPSRGTLYFNEGNWSVVPRSRDAPLRIGTRSATPHSFLTGGIDEVAIYPCVLTPEQIERHFDVGMGQ